MVEYYFLLIENLYFSTSFLNKIVLKGINKVNDLICGFELDLHFGRVLNSLKRKIHFILPNHRN